MSYSFRALLGSVLSGGGYLHITTVRTAAQRNWSQKTGLYFKNHGRWGGCAEELESKDRGYLKNYSRWGGCEEELESKDGEIFYF